MINGFSCVGRWRFSFLPRNVLLLFALALGACADNDPDAMLAKARAHQARGELNAAVLEVKSILQDHPEHGESRLYLGMLYSESGDYRGAEKELVRARDSNVPAARVLPALAKVLVLEGEARRVLVEISPEAVSEPEAVAGILAARGLAHLSLRQLSEAQADFDKALALRPQHLDARLGRARLLAMDGKAEEGLKEVDLALAASPNSGEAYMLKGDLLRALSRTEEARTAYQTVVTQQAGHVNALLALVSLAIASGKLDDATESLSAVRKAAPGNPMASYFQALISLRKGDFKAAQDAISSVLKVAPTHLPSLLVGGAVEFALGAHELAQTRLRFVLEKAPGNAYARRLLAASYARSGQTQKALELIEPVLKQGTKDPALLAIAGEVHMQLNDYETARKYFEQATAAAPKNAALRTGLGLSRLASGDIEAATADLQSAVELDSSKHQADVLLITTHLQARQFKQALKAAQALQAKQPDNPMAYNMLAAAYIGNSDVPAARRALEKALQVQPAYVPAAMNLAQLDLQEGDKAAARKRFEDILAKDKSNVQAYIALAMLAPRIGAKSSEIEAWLEKARRASPSSIPPLVMLVRLHLQAGELKKALELTDSALAAAPNNPEVLDLASQVQFAAGERNRALSTLTSLVSIRPRSAAAFYRMGAVQYSNEDIKGAIGSVRKALQLAPRFPEAQALLAQLEDQDGRPAEGLKIAETLQRQNPNSGVGWGVEGDIRWRGGDHAGAAKAYERAYTLAPSAQLAVKLHGALVHAGKAGEGERMLKEWLDRSPADDGVRSYLGEAYLKAGKFKEAADAYQVVLTRRQSDVIVLNNLAWCYQQLGDPRAIETAEKALALSPENPAVLDTAGWLLVENKDYQRGVELLKKAASKAPNAAEIRFHYAVSLVKSGSRYRAKDELERLLLDFPKFDQHAQASKLIADLKATGSGN